jgi:DNA-binding MarR family transcriptional regulator
MPKIRMPADFHDQTPDANVLATEAVMNTIRTADMAFERIGRLLRPLNVSLLRDHGPMAPSVVGDRLIVTRATVTGLLDSLERRGLVRRSANPADRRSLVVEITPLGLEVIHQVRTIIHRHETAWMSVLSDAELQAYIALLHRMQDSIAAAPET